MPGPSSSSTGSSISSGASSGTSSGDQSSAAASSGQSSASAWAVCCLFEPACAPPTVVFVRTEQCVDRNDSFEDTTCYVTATAVTCAGAKCVYSWFANAWEFQGCGIKNTNNSGYTMLTGDCTCGTGNCLPAPTDPPTEDDAVPDSPGIFMRAVNNCADPT